MSSDFAVNLRLLCSYHRSIAEVCEALGINRSQFNRYLSGETFPSLRTMRRICDFFGVEESEILLPKGRFSNLVTLKPQRSGARAERNVITAVGEEIRLSSVQQLDPYLGYYFSYYNSLSHPGLFLRSLTRIYRTPFGINAKTVESIGLKGKREFTCKYEGACFVLGDRIFLTVMEMLTRNEAMQIILYPSYNNRIRYLSGVLSGVAARAPHPPAATQIVFEYLGQTPNVRACMKQCALYPPDDPEVPDIIQDMLTIGVRAGTAVLEAPLS